MNTHDETIELTIAPHVVAKYTEQAKKARARRARYEAKHPDRKHGTRKRVAA